MKHPPFLYLYTMAKKNKTTDQPANEGETKTPVENPGTEETTKEETTDSGENHDADQDETKEENTVTEETTEETTTEETPEEKETPAEEEKVEPVKAEDKKPTKPKKEWKHSFKPGDNVAVWGTGNSATMKKGKKFNTTGAMAAILIENGSASLEEIKPDEPTK